MKKYRYSGTKFILKKIIEKGERSLIDFWKKSQIEVKETKEAEKIFIKYIEGKEVTEAESKALKNQTFDLIRVIFIGVPLAIIPGFSIVMILVVKIGRKYKLNLLPSSFTSSQKEDIKNK